MCVVPIINVSYDAVITKGRTVIVRLIRQEDAVLRGLSGNLFERVPHLTRCVPAISVFVILIRVVLDS